MHVQPIASSNKLVRSIPCERAVGVGTKIGFVKAGHRGRQEVGVPDLEPIAYSIYFRLGGRAHCDRNGANESPAGTGAPRLCLVSSHFRLCMGIQGLWGRG